MCNSKITQLQFVLIIFLLVSCNNNAVEKDNNLKDTVMTTSSNQKVSVAVTRDIPGPDGTIFIAQNGEGGTPVFFIHSFGGSTAHWQNQMQHLNTRTIAMDIRGHGNSAAPANNDYAVESMVKDLETVVDSLQLDKFILVGHSMGGSIAISYAAKHPEKVAGLLITGTPGKTPAAISKPVIASLQSSKYDTVMNDYMKKLLMNATPETNKLEMEGMSKINKEASISFIRSIFEYDPLPHLKKYNGPKYFVFPEADQSPNSLHIAFPAVPYKTVSGTSHWIQLDKPGEFNKILDEFVTMIAKEK